MTDVLELNASDKPAFDAQLALLFEPCPTLAAHLWRHRPFPSLAAVIDKAAQYLGVLTAAAGTETADEATKLAVLNAHPAIGAPKKVLSAASKQEQSHGPAPDAASLQRLQELNAAYQAKFGFPYMVFVNGRPVSSLIPEFEDRLQRQRDSELVEGLNAFISVARSRLQKLTVSANL